MTTKTSRGIRNNNPGNIRKSQDPWQGLAESQPDKEFFTFKSPTWGIRALARVLIAYQDKHDLCTINGIISRWAPPVENNTKAYVQAVAKSTGFDANQFLDLHKAEYLLPLVKAIIQHENGTQPYSEAELVKGLVLAGVEPETKPLSSTRTIPSATVAAGATSAAIGLEVVGQIQPAFPLLQTIAQYAPIVLGLIVLAAIAYVIYARIDDRRKGLR